MFKMSGFFEMKFCYVARLVSNSWVPLLFLPQLLKGWRLQACATVPN